MIRRCLLALLVSSWALVSQGQSRDGSAGLRIEGKLRDAQRALERRDYPVALAELEQAAQLAPDPRVDYYLARTHAKLGKLVEAADAYRSAIAGVDRDETRPALRQVLSSARDELAELRPRIPALEVAFDETRLRDWQVELDGRSIGFNAAVSVNPGSHELVAHRADDESLQSSFQINEGEAKTVAFDESAPAARGAHPTGPHGSGSTRREWSMVKLSVGQTGLGMGTVTGTLSGIRVFAGDRHCVNNRCPLGTPAPDDGSALRDLRTITPAGYVLGAAGISTWLGLLVGTPPEAANAEHPRVSAWTPIVGLGSAGARYIF